MGSQRDDIMNSYQPLISAIKSFRGSDAYILDIIAKVSSLPPKVRTDIKLKTVTDVVRLLTMIKTNKL